MKPVIDWERVANAMADAQEGASGDDARALLVKGAQAAVIEYETQRLTQVLELATESVSAMRKEIAKGGG